MVKRPRPVRLPNIVQVRLSDELLKQVDEEARRTSASRSDAIRRLVERALAVG